jgi:hypothetical protein
MLFIGPFRSFRAILSSRSFSRGLTREVRVRPWTAGTAERWEMIWCDRRVVRENRGKDFRTEDKNIYEIVCVKCKCPSAYAFIIAFGIDYKQFIVCLLL